MVWNTSSPSGNSPIRQGDDSIREFKQDIQTALLAEGDFPVDVNNPKFYYRGTKGSTASRPTRGGFFFDTDRNMLQRDNGSSWEDVGTLIPSGTYMLFKQSTAPTGWTKVSNSDWYDSFIRIVDDGGSFENGQGGAWCYLSSNWTDAGGSHSHTVDSHTHHVGGSSSRTNGIATFAREANYDYRIQDDGAGWVNHDDATNPRHLVVDAGGNQEGRHDHIIDLESDASSPGTSTDGNHSHSISRSYHDTDKHRFTDVIVAQKD